MARMPNLVLVLRLKVTYNKIEAKIMKKKIILLFAVLTLFITAVSPIYAKESPLLPPWFTNAIKPIQDSLSSLFQKTDNHEARIIELESKIATLEGKIISLETQLAEMKRTNFTIGTGGVLYYQNNPVGIGTSSSNFIQIDCSSWNCNSDLLKINN